MEEKREKRTEEREEIRERGLDVIPSSNTHTHTQSLQYHLNATVKA